MALTLDATLQTAQESLDRKPIIEILSQEAIASIPYDGNIFEQDNDSDFAIPLLLADGRIVTFFAGVGWNGDYRGLYIKFTDADQTTFGPSTKIVDFTYDNILSISATILSSGNIGVCVLWGSGSSYLRTYIINTSGSIVDETSVEDSTKAVLGFGASVAPLSGGGYIMIYPKLDSGVYRIYKRTSSDFDTWSSATELTIGGRDTSYLIQHPDVKLLSNDDLMLACSLVTELTEDSDQKNIVYSISSDDGATWSNFINISNYTVHSKDATYPDITERTNGDVEITFNLSRVSLVLNPDTSPYWFGQDDAMRMFHVDWTDRKVYFISQENGIGWKNIDGIGKVDMDTWTLEQSWSNTTTPAIHPLLWNKSIAANNCFGDRHIVAFATDEGGTYKAVGLLDAEANQFTNYFFCDCAEYSVTKNVTCSDIETFPTVYWCKVDYDNNRTYIGFMGDGYLTVGYIELDDPGPTYTFYRTLYIYAPADWGSYAFRWMEYLPDQDICILCHIRGAYGNGHTYVICISEQAEIKHYTHNTHYSYPFEGVRSTIYSPSDYCLYCAPIVSLGSYPEQTGLLKIDLETDVMQYIKPEFDPYGSGCNEGDFGLLFMTSWKSSNELIVPNFYGLDVFNIVTHAWVHYSEDNMPGLIPQDAYHRKMFYFAFYDSVNDMFMGSHNYGVYHEGGFLIAFHPDRLMEQPQYISGTYTTSWEFDDPKQLVQAYLDKNLRSTLLSDNNLFSTWTVDQVEFHLKWDKEGAELNFADYLLVQTPVKWRRSINGDPNSIEFEVGAGHLFDRTNTDSLLSIYAKRGRKIVLRAGDTVSDVDYWANQGSFYVSEVSMTYALSQNPVMRIVAKDKREHWSQHLVEVSSWEDTQPDVAIKGVVMAELDYDATDFDIPTFACSFTDEGGFTVTLSPFAIDEQWIDTYLNEIVEQIANRFGYYTTMDVDDKVTCRKISNKNSTNHTYSNNTKLLEYTPDDSYSDNTNRIIVTGEERDYTEMIYGEERIHSLSGTVGWWGFHKDFTIWYSEDRSRRVKFPRLVVIESATSIMFKLAGKIREKISEEDTENNLYCVVEIKAPNLIPHLVAAISAYIAGNIIGDGCPTFGGLTIPIGRILEGLGIVAAMMILGSVGNFQYEIWGRPVGHIRRGLSAQADDEELQAEIGCVITNKIDGFACDTYARCKNVASFELMIARMQRKRLKIKKITHLQDQEGDTIVFKHPYTGTDTKMFVTDLTRSFKKSSMGKNDGHFEDEIEGWVI